MAHKVIKILVRDDGDEVDKKDQVWCLGIASCGDDATFCTNEYVGSGASAAEYESKIVNRGGITCPQCLEKIKTIKAIKL